MKENLMSYFKHRAGACAIVALLLQNTIAPLAYADPYGMPLDTDPRLMFYVSKSFGESRELYKAPRLGLRLEQDVERDIDGFRLQPDAMSFSRQTYLDLRWTHGFGESVRLFGVPVHRSPQQLNSAEESLASGSGESSGGYGNIILYSAIGIGLLCVFETVICEDDGPKSPGREDEPDSPGLSGT